MDLTNLCKSIKSTFRIVKKVEIDGIFFELEPISTLEETKVFEYCEAYEGRAFLEALKKSSLAFSLKKINDIDLTKEEIERDDENGNKIKESKFIFIANQLDEWPSSLVTALFEAYSNMIIELEGVVNKKVKYNKFNAQETVEDIKPAGDSPIPPGFTKIEESEKESG